MLDSALRSLNHFRFDLAFSIVAFVKKETSSNKRIVVDSRLNFSGDVKSLFFFVETKDVRIR